MVVCAPKADNGKQTKLKQIMLKQIRLRATSPVSGAVGRCNAHIRVSRGSRVIGVKS